MATDTLHIKNMVCDRCIKVVKNELANLGLPPERIKLGEVRLREPADEEKIGQLKSALAKHGFELLDDKKAKMIDRIRSIVIEQIHHRNSEDIHYNFSRLIEQELGLDYNYLSSLFSATENTTIEKYIILQRIERVKELLVYDELSLSQIADQLGYRSVQHLSNQFKKVTGFTPSYFKKRKENQRKPLDEV